MVDYLRETVREIDSVVAGWAVKRAELAVKLTAIEASSSPAVREAAADFERRQESGTPYEDARDAESVLSEAFKRYGPQ
jgi:hypothetical protein